MAFETADRVRETSTTTGTGTLDLSESAPSTYQTFASAFSSGATVWYVIVHRSADEWETGEGTYTAASPDTLSRDTVFESSNSNSAVTFSSGTKDVYAGFPSDKFLLAVQDETVTGAWTFSGNVTTNGTISANGDIGIDGATLGLDEASELLIGDDFGNGRRFYINSNNELVIDPTNGDTFTRLVRFDQKDGSDLIVVYNKADSASRWRLNGNGEVEWDDTSGSATYWLRYDDTNSQFELESTDVDGGGTNGLIFSVADGTDVLDFTSTPTVGGTNVVLETRSLTGGNGIDAIGDLSADRTVAISTDGVGTDEIDLSIAPTWTGVHTFASSADDEDRAWIIHDPTALESSLAKFRVTVADRDHNAGSTENVIYRWGYNQKARDTSGVADSGTDSFSFADVLETHFEPNTAGDGNFERYGSFSDGTNEYRPWSFVVPKETVGSTRFKDENRVEYRAWSQIFRPNSTSTRRFDLQFNGNDPFLMQVKDGKLQILRQDASVSDNSALNAELQLTGKYDSDSGASVSASPKTFTIRNEVAHNGGSGSHELSFIDHDGTKLLTLDGDTDTVGIDRPNPTGSHVLDINGSQQWVLPTEVLEVIDAGSTGATEQDWVEVQVGGTTGYLRVFSSK